MGVQYMYMYYICICVVKCVFSGKVCHFYKPNQIASCISLAGLLPGNDKEHTADAEASQQHIHPDIRRQRVEEGEHSRIGAVGFVVEDADPKRHERLGEVYHLFPHIGDGERGHGEVGHLVPNKSIKQSNSQEQLTPTATWMFCHVDRYSHGR